MRKVKTLLLLLVMAMLATVGATAGEVNLAAYPVKDGVRAEFGPKVSEKALQVVESSELIKVKAQAASPAKAKAVAKKSVSSVDDLVGKYVMTFKSLTTSAGDGGSSVVVSKLSSDSIQIDNFWTTGTTLKAKVDLTAKTVTIANQVAFTSTSYGACDVAVITSAGKPDRTSNIVGTINADGSISIPTWWAVFIKAGTNKDKFLAAGYSTEVEKANASMTVTYADTSTVDVWNVVLAQTAKNIIAVKNFGNHGQTVEVKLNPDSSFTIASQLAYAGNTTMGNFYTYAVADWSVGALSNPITGKGTDSSLKFGSWVMYSSNKYYTGELASGTIASSTFKISYPILTVTGFQGTGTQADPYQIKTLEDLVLLANKVNSDTERNYGGPYSFHTRTFLGKYFQVQNDIDASDYRFEPIGDNWNQRFAGTFDGNSHKISHLQVSTGTTGYAGLFGIVDTVSVIKNLTVDSASITSASYYAAPVAGWSLGTVDNCVASGTVTNTGVCAAGIVGYAHNVTNCSFTGTINGLGGLTGGIAGEATGAVENCHAQATIKVSAPLATYSGGGVVGTLYKEKASCKNSYFIGSVDGTGIAGLFVGGVVGQVYKGVVDRCFSVADVFGLGNESANGGVVGWLGGTLTNSYATGDVQCVSSKKTGGIVGYVTSYTDNNAEVASVVKNCYTACRMKAETYLYNSAKEVRETLGTIDTTKLAPSVENVYFDKQMCDFTSANYAALTSALTSANGPAGFSTDNWVFAEGYYPRLKGQETTQAAKLSASVVKFDTAFPDNTDHVANDVTLNLLGNTHAYLYKEGKLYTAGYDGTVNGSTYKLNGNFGTDTLCLYDGVMARIYFIKVAPKFLDGIGSKSNPYLIKTKADLMKLAQVTSIVEQYYKDTYFLQTNDIDMGNDSTFIGICNSWTNTAHCQFAGHYDGGHHALHHMVINYVGWTTPPTATSFGTPNSKASSIYKGFIGCLGAEGSVSNLTIAADCQYSLWGYSGGVVGYNYGTIDSCKNYAQVNSYSSTVGGITGYNVAGGVVKNCLNAGNVRCGFLTVGGIAGSSAGTIENCMNIGTVEAKQLSTFESRPARLRIAGGIVGSGLGTVLRNVVNAGHVMAAGDAVGGIAGSWASSSNAGNGNNDIYNAVNYGTVFSSDLSTTGGVAGTGVNTAATNKNVYFDAQVTGLQAAANDVNSNIVAAKTADLTSGSALSGFPTDVFTFKAGKYPYLTQFANDSLVAPAVSTILGLAGSETVKGIKSDAKLTAATGATWTLAQAKSFSIDGNLLKPAATVTGVVRDTLTVSVDGFVKPYALAQVSNVPLAGSGTKADPFQITNPAEWDAFANYIATTENPFNGQYVKVMNNINFSDTTFVPLAFDGVTPFGGYLDGNNDTISGIKYTATDSYQGAICYVGAGAVISNLTLAGAVTTAKTFVGGFAGKVCGQLVNCTNNINVTATATYSGGFAGAAEATSKFTGCVNNGTVNTTKGYTAGFAASAASGITFEDCVNNGSVTNTATTGNVGGFVGYGAGTHFVRCVNKGEISSPKGTIVGGLQGLTTGADSIFFVDCHNDSTVTGASSVGGLLGTTATSYSAVKTPIIASNCYNSGDIISMLSSTYGTAGLFGDLTPSSVITDCYNTGNVLATKAVYTGGIWGYQIGAVENTAIKVSRCYNTGNIVAVNYGGGIGGVTPAYTSIDSCYNTGEISAALAAGGITGGIMGANVSIRNSWNAGAISTTKNGCGGISGYGYYYSHITNCFNAGTVSGATNIGGVQGQGSSIITNSYNDGVITGTKNVGGLVGMTSSGSAKDPGTQIYNCYNAGKVTPVDTLCGNIVGAPIDTAKFQVVSNTYYVTDFGTFALDSVATATTLKALSAATQFQAAPRKVYGIDSDYAAGWDYADEYTLPIIPGFTANDCAKANAAVPVLTDSDTYDNVTKNFFVGSPENVTWSSSDPVISFSEGSPEHAYITKASTAEVVLTATCGKFSRSWNLKLNATTGVDNNVANKVVVKQIFYSVAGILVPKPENHDGQIYVVVSVYDDGTTSTGKYQDR
jgi:hypothetical protein